VRYKSLCPSCVHYSEDEVTGEPFCEAFGGPPPPEILQSGFDHRNEYPGDNGVRYTPSGPVDVKFLDSFKS
jgi:hypothetical protein